MSSPKPFCQVEADLIAGALVSLSEDDERWNAFIGKRKLEDASLPLEWGSFSSTLSTQATGSFDFAIFYTPSSLSIDQVPSGFDKEACKRQRKEHARRNKRTANALKLSSKQAIWWGYAHRKEGGLYEYQPTEQGMTLVLDGSSDADAVLFKEAKLELLDCMYYETSITLGKDFKEIEGDLFLYCEMTKSIIEGKPYTGEKPKFDYDCYLKNDGLSGAGPGCKNRRLFACSKWQLDLRKLYTDEDIRYMQAIASMAGDPPSAYKLIFPPRLQELMKKQKL